MTADPYQYVVLQCVPRADRGECLNVGVVVYCEAGGFLDCAWRVDEARLRALDPGVELDRVGAALEFVTAVCRGEAAGGEAARQPAGQRFGFVKAPRSTVLRPGPVHGGLTDDPGQSLTHLLDRYVR